MKKAFAALLLLICSVNSVSYAQQPKSKMTIATGIDPSLAVFYVAKLGGYFEANGLDVQLNTGASGSAMVPLLINNQVQAVLAGEQAGIQTFALDKDVVVAAEIIQALKYFALVGPADVDLKNLKGKKIGVSFGNASEVFWRALVTKTGIDPNSVQVVNVEQPEMLAALARKDIDAASAYEPWVSRIIQSVPGSRIIRDNEGILNARSYLYINREWASANKAQATAFMKALIEADNQIRTQPEKSAQQVSTFLKLDLPLTKMIMGKLNYQIRLDTDSVDYLKTIDAQLRASGKLKTTTDWNRFIYRGLIQDAKK